MCHRCLPEKVGALYVQGFDVPFSTIKVIKPHLLLIFIVSLSQNLGNMLNDCLPPGMVLLFVTQMARALSSNSS